MLADIICYCKMTLVMALDSLKSFLCLKDITDTCKCTKLRWFQTLINHRILPTNHLLNKMSISDDPKCTFCGEENETTSHLLWNCSHTNAFITELTKQFQYRSIILDLNEKSFILSLYPNIMQEIIQLLLLIVKYYIYMCRNNKCAMNFKVYKSYVKTFYQT